MDPRATKVMMVFELDLLQSLKLHKSWSDYLGLQSKHLGHNGIHIHSSFMSAVNCHKYDYNNNNNNNSSSIYYKWHSRYENNFKPIFWIEFSVIVYPFSS